MFRAEGNDGLLPHSQQSEVCLTCLCDWLTQSGTASREKRKLSIYLDLMVLGEFEFLPSGFFTVFKGVLSYLTLLIEKVVLEHRAAPLG